jgi:hypothetical protein
MKLLELADLLGITRVISAPSDPVERDYNHVRQIAFTAALSLLPASVRSHADAVDKAVEKPVAKTEQPLHRPQACVSMRPLRSR